MADLPGKYDQRLRRLYRYRAVWDPGTPMSLGDYGTLKNGLFVDIGTISEFGVVFRKKARRDAALTLNAQGVSETLIQGGVEVPSVGDLSPTGKAELKIKFGRSHSYYLKTTKLSGAKVDNLRQVGKQIAKLEEWRFRDYYFVWRILEAEDFTFLGSKAKNREYSLSGSVKAIEAYLNAGISAGISGSSTRKLDIELVGKGGPIAVGITRFKKDGRPRDV